MGTSTTEHAESPALESTRREYLKRWHQSLSSEHGFVPLRVEGRIPEDLRGTLYRNGPASYECFGEPYRHLFDGDGAVTAVRLAGGRAEGACRFVQSRGRVEEQRRGRRLYGAGATPARGWWRRLGGRGEKNVANIHVLWWNQRLMALYEGNRPTELSPDDLSTLGETDLGGLVRGTFSAHPHYLPARNAYYNFGLRYGRHTRLDLFELRPGGSTRRLGSLPLPDFTVMLHDFAVTPNHLVFFIPPVRMRAVPLMLGLKAPLECMGYEAARGTEVVVVPIDAPERATRFHTEAFFQYHFVNAFEQDDGRVVVDFPWYAEFPYADLAHTPGGGPPDVARVDRSLSLRRAVVDLQRQKVDFECLNPAAAELPTIHPARQGAPHRFAYLVVEHASEGTPSLIGKLDALTGDLQTLDLGAACFPSESLFVPRWDAASEDDGYLLSLVYDAQVHRSFLAVLDARDLERGPLARAWFEHHVPFTLHGTFVPGPLSTGT